jgi:hypothetical protein
MMFKLRADHGRLPSLLAVYNAISIQHYLTLMRQRSTMTSSGARTH